MSVDVLTAAMAVNAELAAIIEAELAQLAADAQALRGVLVTGAVATARVLPSNGLTDLIEIAGRRVAASLPPTVRPGDVLQVRVSGFDGERILLQVIGTGADVAVETAPIDLPPDVAVGLYLPPTPAPAAAAPANATPVAPASAPPPPAPGAPAAAVAPPPAVPPARPLGGSIFTSIVSRANVTPAAPSESAAAPVRDAPVFPRGTMPRAVIVIPNEPTSIETRVAAARAAVGQPTREAAPNALAPSAPAPAPRPFLAPPPIAAKPSSAPLEPTPHLAAAKPTPQIVATKPTGLSAYTEPVALLRALRLPVTPANVASASLALQHPSRLPAALAALERALPRASSDPNVATLRTLLAFVGRIDPRSPALATQIAAYVDHVVDGPESKLTTMLAAARASVVESEPDAPPPSRAFPADPPPPLPLAVVAERSMALSSDLKQTMLALAADPASAPSAAPALAGALTALTAVQVNAAQTLAAQPDGVAFTIPLSTPNGTANAHISVKRDAPESRRGAPLDAANFRIAFILETAHYGTVAIDVVTVGREVTVDVRTESAPAMRAFRDALGALTARLEALHYRVASAGASLGSTSTIAVETTPAYQPDPDATVDRSA